MKLWSIGVPELLGIEVLDRGRAASNQGGYYGHCTCPFSRSKVNQNGSFRSCQLYNGLQWYHGEMLHLGSLMAKCRNTPVGLMS